MNMSIYNKPVLSGNHKTIKYGLYPQKNVDNNKSLVNSLNNLKTKENNGWYLYDNAYYAKVAASSTIAKDVTFSNHTSVESSKTYWFKCEPITWNVLTEKKGRYYVVSSKILDTRQYNSSGSSNKYDTSSIRSFLLNTFLKTAFADDSFILTTTVNNSASTTDSYNNPNVCDSTQDKVFMPSYLDYNTESYGFSKADSRKCVATDLAVAKGTTISKDRYGLYWTRSPYSNDYSKAWYISGSGGRVYTSVNASTVGVRPAMYVTIK